MTYSAVVVAVFTPLVIALLVLAAYGIRGRRRHSSQG